MHPGMSQQMRIIWVIVLFAFPWILSSQEIIYNNAHPYDRFNDDPGLVYSDDVATECDPPGLYSYVQDETLGLGTTAFSTNSRFRFQLADDFHMPTPGRITRIRFYAKEATYPDPAGFTHAIIRIWDGPPEIGEVIYGDLNLIEVSNTGFLGIYRRTESDILAGCNRKIDFIDVDVDIELPVGTYWLDWSLDNEFMYSIHSVPPITKLGMAETGNALRSYNGATRYFPAVDYRLETGQGLPFILYGTLTAPVPTLSEWSMLILFLLLFILLTVAIRSRQPILEH